MNFKRGMFRLWIVFSCIFMLAVFMTYLPDLKSILFTTNMITKHGVPMAPVICADARGKSGDDYSVVQNPWDLPWTESPPEGTIITNGLCWYEMPKLRKLYPEYNDLSDEALLQDLYKKTGIQFPNDHPWETIGRVSEIALGIPAGIFAFGFALFWVGAGFRKS